MKAPEGFMAGIFKFRPKAFTELKRNFTRSAINTPYNKYGDTLLMWAARHHLEGMEWLLMKGADITIKNKSGKTAQDLLNRKMVEAWIAWMPVIRAQIDLSFCTKVFYVPWIAQETDVHMTLLEDQLPDSSKWGFRISPLLRNFIYR